MKTHYEQLDRAAIERVKAYLEEHYQEPFDVEELAMMVCFSVSKLNKTFKRFTCCGPAGYHRRLRIQKAQEIARSNGENWTIIGYQLGYSDLPSFSKAFKRITGMSPRDFRAGIN